MSYHPKGPWKLVNGLPEILKHVLSGRFNPNTGQQMDRRDSAVYITPSKKFRQPRAKAGDRHNAEAVRHNKPWMYTS
jgi:hypothetical protein